MARYGYLICEDCKVYLWLGKAISNADRVQYFHIGGSQRFTNIDRPIMNKVLWKMLADHTSHTLRVKVAYEFAVEVGTGYSEIGGEGPGDTPFDTYVSGWPPLDDE